MLVTYHDHTGVFPKRSVFSSKDEATQAAKLMYHSVRKTFDLTDREEELLEELIHLLMHNVNEELNVFITLTQISDLLDEGRKYRIKRITDFLKENNLIHMRYGIITMTYLEGGKSL